MGANADFWNLLMAVCLGVGLSAACGFRVFMPMFFLSIATRAGHIELAEGWAWVGESTTIAVLGVATTLEIGAYYIPWLDNLLDTIATPAAVIAGTLVTAACVGDMSPLMKWTLALIAGGGAAAMVQAGTTATRAVSTAATGGLANPIVSTAEAGAAAVLSVAALLLPIVAAVAVVVLGVYTVRQFRQWAAKRNLTPILAPQTR